MATRGTDSTPRSDQTPSKDHFVSADREVIVEEFYCILMTNLKWHYIKPLIVKKILPFNTWCLEVLFIYVFFLLFSPKKKF